MIATQINTEVKPKPSAEIEEWRVVEGFPNYRVSNEGRIQTRYSKSLPRNGRKLGIGDWRTLSYRPANTGYIPMNLYEGDKLRRVLIHHLVLETFVGPRPDGMVGCHANGKRDDNRLVNLRWDTYKANEEDKRTHGMRPYGEDIINAKLTNAEAIEIMRLIREGDMRQADIARKFNVSPVIVSEIKNGKRYKAIIEAEYGPVIQVHVLTEEEMQAEAEDYEDNIADRMQWMRGAW